MTELLTTELLTKRLQVSPSEYLWAKEQYEACLQNAWSHTEVAMQSDCLHWHSNKLTDNDRKAIAGILRGFTVLETVVGDHWANLALIFPKPEIVALCRAFSAQEWVHAYGYDLLETTLGIAEENWEAFKQDKEATKKLTVYTDYLALDSIDNLKGIAQGLAVFGGCAEGVSLFGSFAILLSYTNKGLFPGMNQILSWSVRDEDLHSNCAIRLYHELTQEYPKTRISAATINALFRLTVDLEASFIKPAFAEGVLSSGVSFDDAIKFIKHRANLKLKQLGYSEIYKDTTNSIEEWFYPLTGGVPINDFFMQRANGAAYAAKLVQDFTDVSFTF